MRTGSHGGYRGGFLGHGARHSAGAFRTPDSLVGVAIRRSSMRCNERDCNERYLPDASFPPALTIAGDPRAALAGVRDVLVAVPSHAFRATTLEQIERHLGNDSRVAWATKGFEISTGLLPHQVASEVLAARPGAVLSGPTFAKEVGAGLPTAMTVASRDPALRERRWPRTCRRPSFRAYMQSDNHRGRSRRCREERHCHRLGYRRRDGLRRQYARSAHHARGSPR